MNEDEERKKQSNAAKKRLKELVDENWDKIPLHEEDYFQPMTSKYERTKKQLPNKSKGEMYKCYRVNLHPNEQQKRNLYKVRRLATEMYNETVSVLEGLRSIYMKEFLEAIYHIKKGYIRDTYMIGIKQDLIKKYKTDNFSCDTHILDVAIEQAVRSFKSAQTNLERGNIKNYEVKYKTADDIVIEIERDRFKCISIIEGIFGKETVKCELENKIPFHTAFINSTCTLKYFKRKNKFQLIVNQRIGEINGNKFEKYPKSMKEATSNFNIMANLNTKQQKIIRNKFEFINEFKLQLKDHKEIKTVSENTNTKEIFTEKTVVNKPVDPIYSFASLDPGLSSFMTCATDKDWKKYGEGTYEKILKILKRKEKALRKCESKKSNKKFTRRKRHKFSRRLEKKIHNVVKDLHCKTACELSNNCEEVIIGNMSSKALVMNDTFSSLEKQAILRMRFYQFRQRLKYQCELKGRTYICVHEGHTSRTCSVCGSYKNDLKLSDRRYNCSNCTLSCDRDLNACRNIWFQSLDKKNFKPV